MNKQPEFLQKGFSLNVNIWCEKEGCITRHLLEVVNHDDNHVSYWKTCEDCQIEYQTLRRLGVDKGNPRKADRMKTVEYIFLVLHPVDIIE